MEDVTPKVQLLPQNRVARSPKEEANLVNFYYFYYFYYYFYYEAYLEILNYSGNKAEGCHRKPQATHVV